MTWIKIRLTIKLFLFVNASIGLFSVYKSWGEPPSSEFFFRVLHLHKNLGVKFYAEASTKKQNIFLMAFSRTSFGGEITWGPDTGIASLQYYF